MKYILGIDPGFANIGICLFDLDSNSIKEIYCLKTNKSKDKNITVTNDNLERLKEVFNHLEQLYKKYPFTILVSESLSMPRNAATASRLSLIWSLLYSFCLQKQIEFHHFGPQKIKKHFTGNNKAEKIDMRNKFIQLFGDDKTRELFKNTIRTLQEHPIDAFASIFSYVKENSIDIKF